MLRMKANGGWLATGCTYLVVFVVFALPVLWILFKTMQPEDALFSDGAVSLTLGNYVRAMQIGDIASYTISTCLIAIATCLIVLPLGFVGGYAFARFQFPGRASLLFMFMFSLTIPGLVNLLAIYQVFNMVRLLNNPFGLILVYAASNLPMATWLMRAHVQSIPREIEQAALVDGATRVSSIWYVSLPIALPGIAAVAVLIVVHVFHEFIVAQTLITTRGVGIVTQGLYAMQSEYGFDYTALAAGSILVSFVPVLLFLVLQRQFISGMTAGAVTG
jgi:ABC-type glycerol-3-phosphate transport system permease component